MQENPVCSQPLRCRRQKLAGSANLHSCSGPLRIDIRADVRADMHKRTALEHAPLLIRTRARLDMCENKKTPEGVPAKGEPNTSRGLRGNQDGEAVGRWHTAAVAYCRLRAPAAGQCLKTNQLTRTPEPSPRADSSWHPDPLYRTEVGAWCSEGAPAPSLGPPARSRRLPPVCCASAGADRPECGICADPAYVVIPQAKNKNKTVGGLLDPTWPSCRGTHRAGGCHQCDVRGVGVVHRRPDGRGCQGGVGASRGAKQAGPGPGRRNASAALAQERPFRLAQTISAND
jgi:hypothetical protein